MSNRIIPIIVLIAAVALFFLYINPTWTGSIASTKAEITNYESALNAANQYQMKQAELMKEKNAISSDNLSRLDDFLPDGVDNVQLILDLDSLAARTGVALSNFDTQDSSASNSTNSSSGPGSTGLVDAGNNALSLAKSPVDSIQISLTATATYASFRAFLSGIEHSLRMLDVMNITISPSSNGVYNYQMTLRLYWLH